MAGASVFACCSLFIMALMAAAAIAGSVPALYVFGDSLVDVGNNNHLLTPIKADFTHNGMDYPGRKATGRFSNGKNSADFLADKLGLATLSSSSNANYVNGVNFASGGAGVSNATNKNKCITFDKQMALPVALPVTQACTHLSRAASGRPRPRATWPGPSLPSPSAAMTSSTTPRPTPPPHPPSNSGTSTRSCKPSRTSSTSSTTSARARCCS
ncbi:hypothetical protein CFC21_080293 [Triticum aestivum]|uniref:GDSL esterase/lipase n=2 Tax=Triticum aestivum TaxID=4565 RepID=A0A3B6N0P3_WHEAT|nr:hypothetical protein CFC21_080293 [Triticum aestivum]